jgi:hypothetical protein
MRERGFPEFTEEMPPTPTAEDLGAVAPSLSTLSEHGYGVSENLRLQIDNSLEDHGSDEMPAWRAELSPSQQSALLADEVACQKLALDKFPHPLVLNTSTDAYEQIQAAKRSIEGGPEITAIWTEWSRCMQGRGYTAPRRDDLVKELNGPADAVIAELEAAQRQATGRLPADSPAIAAARRDAAAIAAREAEVVADDLACAEPMHLEERLREAQLRLEGEYLDDHGDELRQMLAAASSRQAAG